MRYVATTGEREYLIEILDERHVAVDGVVYNVDFESVSGQPIHSLLLNNKSYEGNVQPGEEGCQVLLSGALYLVQVEDEREKRLRASLGGGPAEHAEYHLKAPMPGLVVAIPVEEGQQVAKGDVLVILESMKMQNELKSPRGGTVIRLRVRPGDSVELRATLLSVV
jgi:acetyl/propionyl-CoA carboxylase alpha subunit